MKLDKGMLAAIAALVILGGIVGWRLMAGGDTAVEEAAKTSDFSAPPSIEQLEAAALENPSDSQGWQRLGLALFQTNQFDEAIAAYERATGADAGSAMLWSSLGEAQVMASRDDPMPASAVESFKKALALDSSDPRARYFMAVTKDLSGDHAGALNDWLALLADTPPGAPWETDLVRTIEQVGAINQIDVSERIAQAASTRDILPADALASEANAARGPTAEQITAAGALPPSEQQTMAEGMVARLAARLVNQPDDIDGWIMLMRSYRQLGQDARAVSARDQALSANPHAREQIEAAATALGVG